MKKNRFRFIGLFLVAGTIYSAMAGAGARQAPSVDPFYLKALSDGERLLQAEDFANAALSLEIAVFGLQNDSPRLARALSLYCLAAYKAGQEDRAREAARRLTAAVGKSALSGLGLKPEWTADLEKIVLFFEENPEGAETPGGTRTKVLPSAEPSAKKREASVAARRDRITTLEAAIRANPLESVPYLELHEFYLQAKDGRAAVKTLERLIEKVPLEPRGHYFLGKAAFSSRKFKEAVKRFETVLDLTKDVAGTGGLAGSSLGYLILAQNFLGRRTEAENRCREFLGLSPGAAVGDLDMGEKDKELLRNVLASQNRDKAREPASPPAAEIPRPEKPEEKADRPGSGETAQAQDAARAYGIYDQYLQEDNEASARRTLEALLRRYPSEVRAAFLLAKLDYRRKGYEQAQSRFQSVIKELRKRGDREGFLAEAAAYLVLCAHELRGRQAAADLAQAYRADLEGPALDGLGLEGAEKQVVRDYLTAPRDGPAVGRTLEKIGVQEFEGGFKVEIVCRPPTTFRAFVLENDKKIIIDLFNVSRILAERVITVKAAGLQTIRTGMYQETTARVVLDIVGDIPPYSIKEAATGLVVVIKPPPGLDRAFYAPGAPGQWSGVGVE